MTGAHARPLILVGMLLLLAGASRLEAQAPTPEGYRPPLPPPPPPPVYDQMVSLNPIGLLLEFYNLEYERPVSEGSTLGVAGALYQGNHLVDEGEERDEYRNFDLFWRFYPAGRPMDGWAFGAKVGLTRIDGGTNSGFGFDVNRSWLLGANQNFYVGVGAGLKRLLGSTPDTRFIPSFRIVNLGFAF